MATCISRFRLPLIRRGEISKPCTPVWFMTAAFGALGPSRSTKVNSGSVRFRAWEYPLVEILDSLQTARLVILLFRKVLIFAHKVIRLMNNLAPCSRCKKEKGLNAKDESQYGGHEMKPIRSAINLANLFSTS